MTPSETSDIVVPYRPPTPNADWIEGYEARRAGRPFSDRPLSAPAGRRWEWEAGWERADYEVGR